MTFLNWVGDSEMLQRGLKQFHCVTDKIKGTISVSSPKNCTGLEKQLDFHKAQWPACRQVCSWSLHFTYTVLCVQSVSARSHIVALLDWDWRLVATVISQPVISLSTARINLPTDGWRLSVTSWNTHMHRIHIPHHHHLHHHCSLVLLHYLHCCWFTHYHHHHYPTAKSKLTWNIPSS